MDIMKNISLEQVQPPEKDCAGKPVTLTQETILERRDKVIDRMRRRNLKQLILYADVEHGGNFEYLVGYFPRFEEALLIVNIDGSMTLLLGNENLNKASKARIGAKAVHVSLFSLPNQPNRTDRTFRELLLEAGVAPGNRVGLVGWKLFTSSLEDQAKLYDMPYYIVDTVRGILGDDGLMSNETGLFIGEDGTRTTNNANEIAHYEYGASLASDCILDAMDRLEAGVSELELGDRLIRDGQHTSIVTIAAAGPRYVGGNMFPTDNRVSLGDPVALTVGYRGGSSSRAGYAVRSEEELPEAARDYLGRLAIPYFAAYACWLEDIGIGMTGGELFDRIEAVLPRGIYGWSLCPGHLTAEEEWLSSPIYEGSGERLASGMMFQIDIIPSIPGYGGISAESTVVLADDRLKRELEEQYPDMWMRMQRRREYITDVLGIRLSEDVLPMCGTVAYLRPFLLRKEAALKILP